LPPDIVAPSKQEIVNPYFCVIEQTLRETGMCDWGIHL